MMRLIICGAMIMPGTWLNGLHCGSHYNLDTHIGDL